ncbi:MAG: PAS domain-containing sensor histidine kinase [Clostridiales bacterium]|jgi:two-component system phosphate regulon sensor histidine kinase PhoR|nr:PAS domain-containing sensor histidine kinase [Clostridiales bacterium]
MMRRRVYINMFFLTVSSIVITTALLMVTFYNIFNRQMEAEVKRQALFFEKVLDFHDSHLEYLNSLVATSGVIRVSLIDSGGVVIFDNFQDPKVMGLHLDRPEIKQAFEEGAGQAARFSDTLGEKTFYYALKLDNGSVLRLAETADNNMLARSLPLVIIIVGLAILISYLLSGRLTKRIVSPINNIDLSNSNGFIYDELAPFAKMIKSQKEQINKQILELGDRAATIKTITENMKEGILLLDNKGAILLANDSVLELFNAGGNYVGENTLGLIRSPELQKGIKKTLSGTGCDIPTIINNKNIHVFLNPVFANGVVNGAIALFLDITSKASAEKMRREFSANVSHELKTPLTTILGLSEMIYNDMVKHSDIKNFSGKIKGESSRLIALIEDIIKISEMDEGAGDKQFTNFDIKCVALEVIEQLYPLAESEGISISAVGSKSLIYANKQLIFEMLYNLVENGIKYNKAGGSARITVSTENNKTKIEVADTGIGIAEVHFSRIFERFYRVDKSRSKKTGGTGLGLSIVKHVVEYHGGSIDIKSVLGNGTTITILI